MLSETEAGEAMIFKAILNGCVTNVVAQAEELNGFIAEHLNAGDDRGGTILFYSRKKEMNELLRLVPTESAKLVRVTRYQPETILEALHRVEKGSEAQLYLFPSGFAGSEIAVRLAFRMNGSSLVQARHIEWRKTCLIVKKMVYSSHVLGTFRLNREPYCISLAKGSADSQPIPANKNLRVTEYDMTPIQEDGFVKRSEWIPGDLTKGLEEARFLLIGGRGVTNKGDVDSLKRIADQLGADFGVSRPVAMSGWVPMHQMIGISGAMTKPDVCIVAGVSGAAAFYAGIEKSKFIVAINRDRRSPITRTSDVVIIDDYKAVMDELAMIMKERT
jgi:electron transfer flavoprotein alpha subunit